jgi:hypothetical protein
LEFEDEIFRGSVTELVADVLSVIEVRPPEMLELGCKVLELLSLREDETANPPEVCDGWGETVWDPSEVLLSFNEVLTRDVKGVVVGPIITQEQADEILEGEFWQLETKVGRSVEMIFTAVMYVTQNSAATVDARIIWRRQLS